MSHLDEGTLQAWLDGEPGGLTAGERAEVERHLAQCEACARAAEELDGLSARAMAMLSAEGPLPAKDPDYGDVVARAHRYQAAGRRRWAWYAAAWAASVTIALGVGWKANDIYQARTFEMAASGPPSSPTRERGRPNEPAAAGPGVEERVTEAPQEPPATPNPGVPPATEPERPAAEPIRRPAAPVLPAEEVSAAPAADVVPEPTQVPAAEAVARATTRALVRGRVTDENGRPLPSAQVFVQGTGSGALTSEEGTFSILLDGMPSDSARRLTLRAEIIGFRGDSRPLDVRGGEVASADFHLEEEALALDEIVVTGTGAPTGGRNVTAPPPGIVLSRGRDLGVWTDAGRAEAEARAGFRLLTIPDRAVVRIEVRETPDAVLVRIVQELEGGVVLDLVETVGPLRFEEGVGGDGRTRASIRRGGVSVAAAAPVSAEVLGELLDRLR